MLKPSSEYLQAVQFGTTEFDSAAGPIRADWVLEGQPVSRLKVLSESADGAAYTVIWDCTAGRFNWFYDIDETIVLLEGDVVITDRAGVARRLGAGDSVFFPKGSRAEWHVATYVRKVAFCRKPLPKPYLAVRRIYRHLKRLGASGPAERKASAMFEVGPVASEAKTD